MDLERIVNEYGDALLRMCFLYLKDHAMAEDAVQETFLRAFRHQDDFQGKSSVKTWITRIAINAYYVGPGGYACFPCGESRTL